MDTDSETCVVSTVLCIVVVFSNPGEVTCSIRLKGAASFTICHDGIDSSWGEVQEKLVPPIVWVVVEVAEGFINVPVVGFTFMPDAE